MESVVLLAPLAVRALRGPARQPRRDTMLLAIVTGVLSAVANLLFLAATGHGELAIVACSRRCIPRRR